LGIFDPIVSVIDLSQLSKPFAALTGRPGDGFAIDPREGRLAECSGRFVGVKVVLAENVQSAPSVARAGEKTNDNGFKIGLATAHNRILCSTEMMNSSALCTRRMRFLDRKSEDRILDWKCDPLPAAVGIFVGWMLHDFQLKKD
jgi:hypothetical protein